MFRDRRDAGRHLAQLLIGQAGANPVIVGLPRGGVVVAAEVGALLQAPVDIMVVRKIGCPGQPELGVGALAEGGVEVVDMPLVRALGIDPDELQEAISRERVEVARRVRRYRGGRDPMPVEGRTVIVVDDGLATGNTARAAISALRRRGAQHVILAVPVASEDGASALRRYADEVVVVSMPPFFAIAECYEDFSQTSDEEVVSLLERPIAVAVAR